MSFELLTKEQLEDLLDEMMADEDCVVCGKKAKATCSRCGEVRYCGRDCQVKHWKAEHKAECKS